MKFIAAEPMSLTELDEALKKDGINLVVNRVSTEVDDHIVGSSIYVTIESVAKTYETEDNTQSEEADRFDLAKSILGELDGS